MRIAANPSNRKAQEYPDHAAWFFSPDMHHRRERYGLPLYCDNGAFSGFDAKKWFRMLDIHGNDSEWNVVPDVVADHEATVALWDIYSHKVPSPAFVGQDGCTPSSIPDNATCFFVGGSTEWKLSQDAILCIEEAKRRGIAVHMGRVNTAGRMRFAHNLGVDSIDGSGFARWPSRLDWGIRLIQGWDRQIPLQWDQN